MPQKNNFFFLSLNKGGISIYLSIMKGKKGRRKILFLINGSKKPQILLDCYK